ncbi:hypothetical protein SAMN02745174_02072 [Cetobacterium ceti]|uniref:Uncharacterized protein n=1 Tax=Cetobacterium ceti TaxID=180163 RepID=A0A1T4PWT5_9FUSO|nr:hypothetical protein [Cetobacterium ceti]SJZ95671.1 hypothetical protein SAMN02745174_02072 [Cetobacterium ceti]
MRTESGNSLALERSMNLQCHIMTFEEALRNAKVIDDLDDKRREKMFGLMKWLDDMNTYFNKNIEKILNLTSIENIHLHLNQYFIEQQTFQLKFKESFEIIKNDELYYENLDDELRNYLINYAEKCREELRDSNSNIEMKLIIENKKNKK